MRNLGTATGTKELVRKDKEDAIAETTHKTGGTAVRRSAIIEDRMLRPGVNIGGYYSTLICQHTACGRAVV